MGEAVTDGISPHCVVCGCGGELVYVAAFADINGRWPPEWICVADYCWGLGFRASLGYH